MILLDTCAIIWDALEPNKLTHRAQQAIVQADQQHTLLMADISLWEIAMLIQRKRVEVATTAANFIDLYLQSRNIKVCPITPGIAELSSSFSPPLNNDPADRLIAATAILNHTQVITADQNLLSSQILNTLW